MWNRRVDDDGVQGEMIITQDNIDEQLARLSRKQLIAFTKNIIESMASLKAKSTAVIEIVERVDAAFKTRNASFITDVLVDIFDKKSHEETLQ